MSNSGIFVQEKGEKRGGMSTRQKVCPAPRYQHSQRPHLRHGGDDDRRRAFPPPRRWWQPCVTPYFATRGRGDMRGVPNRSCTQSHPGGGAGLCFRRGAVCIILCTTWLCGAITACHHLRGGIFGTPFGGPRMSPTPRSAKYGATHSANRLPGLEITSPWVFFPLQAEWRRRHPMPDGASPL